ncbi:MlaD family protein [Pseudonocardia abyssalis]|uniref:MCE family protein n=1 Tax=Pseudonocardia abyssalis TaxID=2792008 RepID=A0ABS6URD1_9PSEU|nr:MlaD family protein [Pseudonocardia abyssalis]MBW0113742.1 MCE family protein [Pseudonocardia abyssalis]MBW0134815.1 MCE family protein [Pseudonocardia abyssalis]
MKTKANMFTRALDHARNEPGLLRNVVVVAGLLLLSAVVGGYIFSQARASWPWEQHFEFTATFDQAPAISPGNGQEVRIAGVKVGEIRSASVTDNGDAALNLTLDPEYRVYENARLVLRPKSPLNEMYIELSPGGPPARELAEGDVLPASASVRPVQVDEVFGHLDANVQSALTTLLAESDAALANAPQALPAGLQAADGLVQRMEPVNVALQTRRDALERLMTALAQIAEAAGENDERLARLAASMQATLRVTGERSGDIDAVLTELPGLSDQLRAATGGVLELSEQLDPTLDNLREASDSLPDSLSRVTGVVDRAGEIVDTARPVLENARPVVDDLRPIVGDLNAALPDLKASTERLEYLTAYSLPYLVDLQAFVFNTTSAYSLRDSNGGILRGMQQYSPESLTGLTGLLENRPELFEPPGGAGAPPLTLPNPLPDN